MFKALFHPADEATARAGAGHYYAYKASLVGAAHRFELTDQGLSWHSGRRSGLWRYDKIAAIRLSYRPMGMQHQRFRADLEHADGSHITIMSTSKQTVALMQPQAGYAAFVRQLHRKLQAVGAVPSLQGGLRPVVYRSVVAALTLFGIAMAALLVRALWTGEFAGVAFLLGFGALFAWQIGGFMRRNRPRNYSLDAIPADLLP